MIALKAPLGSSRTNTHSVMKQRARLQTDTMETVCKYLSHPDVCTDTVSRSKPSAAVTYTHQETAGHR